MRRMAIKLQNIEARSTYLWLIMNSHRMRIW